MLAISFFGAAFVVAVSASALGLIGWLLSGSATVVTRVRASANGALDGVASGSGHPRPTPGARPEPTDR